MNIFYEILIQPFVEYGFMQNALIACVVVAISSAPMGVFLVLRRMSLTGDAMSHALLPGVAIGFLISGLSLTAMTIGGIVAGLVVALGSGIITRNSIIREDANLAVFYLISLALGVFIVSTKGNNVDLLNILFGSVLAIDNSTLKLLISFCLFTLILITVGYRLLIIECMDSSFLRSVSKYGSPTAHLLFLFLLVINLVASYHALGTLMSVGLLVLPAVTARFWLKKISSLIFLATSLALAGCVIGIILSFHFDFPISSTIILCLGVFYIISMFISPQGILRYQKPPSHHLRG